MSVNISRQASSLAGSVQDSSSTLAGDVLQPNHLAKDKEVLEQQQQQGAARSDAEKQKPAPPDDAAPNGDIKA